MTKTREFPTEVVASLSSGVLLCQFSDMHEAAEFLMGHPIWTHHFADKVLWKSMQDAILAQYPAMPTEMAGVTPDNVEERVSGLHSELGAVVSIQGGDGHTAMSPLEGIPQGKSTIILANT